MKKIAFLLMVALMSLCLVGCGGGGGAQEDTARDITPQKLKNFTNGNSLMVFAGGTVTARVQISPSGNGDYFGEMIFGETEIYNVRVSLSFPGGLPPEEAEQVGDFTMQIAFTGSGGNILGDTSNSAAGIFFGQPNSPIQPLAVSGYEIKMSVQNGVGSYVWPYKKVVTEGTTTSSQEFEKSGSFFIRDAY